MTRPIFIKDASGVHLYTRNGLIKNHPWVGGSKRTATFSVGSFPNRNGLLISAPAPEFIESETLALARSNTP